MLVTLSNSLWPHGLKAAKLLSPGDFPGKNSGMGRHFFLQGIFLIQVSCIAGGFFTIWEPPWSPWSYPESPILTKLTHWKRRWCWERLKARGEGEDSEWEAWMASPTQWTRVWANSRSWWQTGRPGMQQSMRSQSESDKTEWLNWTELCVREIKWTGQSGYADSTDVVNLNFGKHCVLTEDIEFIINSPWNSLIICFPWYLVKAEVIFWTTE